MKNYKQILEAVDKGIQIALDDYEDIESIGSKSSNNDVIDVKDIIRQRIDLDNYTVDLGLPSRTLWCKYNLGVNPNKLKSAKKWYGDFYAWGEIEPNKSEYTWKTYKWGNEQFDLFKYMRDNFYSKSGKADKLLELLPEDDAATQNIHIGNYKFHIPTKKQFNELLSYTTGKYVERYNNINGLNGMLLMGRNGNTLFLPGSGLWDDAYHDNSCGHYWTSSLDPIDCKMAFAYWFNSSGFFTSQRRDCEENRYIGFSIRPVLNISQL